MTTELTTGVPFVDVVVVTVWLVGLGVVTATGSVVVVVVLGGGGGGDDTTCGWGSELQLAMNAAKMKRLATRQDLDGILSCEKQECIFIGYCT